ncbi:MAG TPA: Hpt domain-containing protein [Bryobacteraceae bacterium]|jgi:HPt (histidine-containing phosphotransfer) domain-containing protein|nr:Hpt domain-containing protein [Bryobacteraceae bacterium]
MLRLLIVDGENTGAGPGGFGPMGTIAVVTASLVEAEEALTLQRFDAVWLRGPEPPDGVAEFIGRLREREKGGVARTPVLRTVADLGERHPGVDALLLEHFDLEALRETIDRLNGASHGLGSDSFCASALPPFDGEAFAAHLGHDAGLIVEIIDLFFVESGQQLPDLHERLDAADYDRMSRIAHTLKGSLSSLQAPGPRGLAQQLEEAAKRHDNKGCTAALTALEASIEAMRPELLALRAKSEGLL